jgi:hypothetical protein
MRYREESVMKVRDIMTQPAPQLRRKRERRRSRHPDAGNEVRVLPIVDAKGQLSGSSPIAISASLPR